MSVFEVSPNSAYQVDEVQASYETSPFVSAQLVAPRSPDHLFARSPDNGSLTTPFAEALAAFDEADLAAEAFETLRAEFEDEEFTEALEALADEAAARHLSAAGTWGQQSEGMSLAGAESEQWMEAVAAQADHLLSELESHFGERPVEGVTAGEIEAVAGRYSFAQEQGGPVGAQQQFLGKLIGKVTKVVSGVGKLVKKGVSALGKLIPLGKLFGFLKKLVRPLLERVLQKAIGKLPSQLQPIAQKLVAKFGGKGVAGSGSRPGGGDPAAAGPGTAGPGGDAAASSPNQDAATGESPWSTEFLADEFDARLAEAVLAPNEAAADELLAEFQAEVRGASGFVVDGPITALDAGRQKLARRLVEVPAGTPPLAEMEEFIPVVMAAMKFIKLGVKVIGRKRVVDFIAKLLATLIQGMVGAQAASQLSHHIADAGLRLLGLEAERASAGTLGAEALVATAEDTIREVLELPAESLGNELLLEAAVQEAFVAAAVRHFPAQVLRADLAQGAGPQGFWVMFPRAAGQHYRYKKYTVIQPVDITRPLARSMVLADGETLEDRLLDAGARNWPIPAEAHFYELLPGAELGHLAAYETDGEELSIGEAALEFEELVPARPLPIAHPAHRPAAAGPGGPHRTLRPGTRLVRLKVPGMRLRRRSPLAVRLDLAAGKPTLHIHLIVSERVSHELVGHLEKQQMVQVVATIRKVLGAPARQMLEHRLTHKLAKRGISLPAGAAGRLSVALAEAMSRAVAAQLPAAAATLSTAAKDPAAGVTLTFGFQFDDRAAFAHAKVGDAELKIRSGVHRD